MSLPHIPKDIATQLPTLFNIYRRLLFWDRERLLSPGIEADQIDPEGSEVNEKQEDDAFGWEKICASRDSNTEKVPELLQYFTFLYGLYPINFMSYIRKPERYLRHANFQGEEVIEVQATEIRQRSEAFRQVHLLHPNFFSMTIESELTDSNRWMNSDAADVVATCVALCEPLVHGMTIGPEVPQEAKPTDSMESHEPDGDVSDHPLLDQNDEKMVESSRVSSNELKDSWRNTASTVVGSLRESMRPPSEERKVSIPLEDSPTLGPLTVRASLPPQLLLTTSQGELEESHKFRGGLERSLPNESQVSFSSSRHREPSVADSYLQSLEQVHIPHSPSSQQSPTDFGAHASSLRREILLLKNELNFERYLKQQHLSHIGQLRRKQVREAAAEAETQNLINSNKSLKTRVEHLQSQMAQIRKESEKSRAQSKKWETDMSAKLRTLKEEKKKWDIESETMRHDLEAATENNEKLKQLVVIREAEELASRQKLQSIGSNVGEVEKLRAEVDKLSANLRIYEAKEFEIERANEKEAWAIARTEILEFKLEAAQKEVEKVRLACNHEIEALKAEIEEAKQDPQGRHSKSFQALLDNALAVSRLQLAEAEKRHAHLLSRYTNLQAQLLTLKDHRDSDEPLLTGGGIHYHFESGLNYGTSSSPDERRVRRRGLSDPDIVDRSGHSFSSPDDHSISYIPIRPARANTSTTGSSPRPSSQNETRRPSSRLANSDLIQHNRSGSADSAQASSLLDIEGIAKQKIKPASDVRVYGRG
jgi:solute carrier family 25 (mitochondrial carrier protein), member 16